MNKPQGECMSDKSDKVIDNLKETAEGGVKLVAGVAKLGVGAAIGTGKLLGKSVGALGKLIFGKKNKNPTEIPDKPEQPTEIVEAEPVAEAAATVEESPKKT
jgi:hypothetical protein